MIKLRKIGLALGGGGARGLAHVGVLKHLEEIQLRPDVVAGTSAGAAVAALYAFDIPLSEIEEELSKLKPIELSAIRLPKLGLVENTGLIDLIERKLGHDCLIEDAKIPLAIKATDVISGQSYLMTNGPVLTALQASCCIPGVYLPVERDDRLLVDGGLTENVPVSALDHLGAHIKIAVNLNGNESYPTPTGILDILANSLDISIDNQTREQLEEADIVISMDLSKYSRFKNDQAKLLIEEGMKAAKSEVPAATWILVRKKWKSLKKVFHNLSPIKMPRIFKKLFQK